MWAFLIAALLSMCMCIGLLLRYAPFASVVTPAQKQTAVVLYVGLTVVNTAILMAMLYAWGMTAAFVFLRYGCLLYSAVMTVVNMLVIKGRIREHLFVSGVVITIHFLILSVPDYIITLLPTRSDMVYLFVVLVCYALLLVITYFPLCSLLRRTMEPLLHLDGGEYWNTVCLIPLAFFGTKFLSLGGDHEFGSLPQLLGSLLYMAVIILVCTSIQADHRRIHDYHVLERQLEGQRIHYAELKVRVEEARKTNHDFKHHIAVIHHYMDIDDKEGLRIYCRDLLGRTDGKGRIPYTGNGAADGVLYHYMQKAQERNIRFQIGGSINSRGISDMDLCVLLGNALDNALNACQTIPADRSISVISQSEKHLLSIMVRNTFDGHVELDGENLLSTKRKGRTGVGIASMRSICDRLGGSMEMQWDDGTFTVLFLLPLGEE